MGLILEMVTETWGLLRVASIPSLGTPLGQKVGGWLHIWAPDLKWSTPTLCLKCGTLVFFFFMYLFTFVPLVMEPRAFLAHARCSTTEQHLPAQEFICVFWAVLGEFIFNLKIFVEI